LGASRKSEESQRGESDLEGVGAEQRGHREFAQEQSGTGAGAR